MRKAKEKGLILLQGWAQMILAAAKCEELRRDSRTAAGISG